MSQFFESNNKTCFRCCVYRARNVLITCTPDFVASTALDHILIKHCASRCAALHEPRVPYKYTYVARHLCACRFPRASVCISNIRLRRVHHTNTHMPHRIHTKSLKRTRVFVDVHVYINCMIVCSIVARISVTKYVDS